ncbi:MAG: sulfite exporter TauE/SafE family protein [Verrucomicrobia bacterium]|nr:sulfite exporter TauE/SafE family protein [Verrucomicrobiota bacterium]
MFLPKELSENLATVFGTNKLASLCGTGVAVVQYAKRVRINWHSILPAAVTAFVFAFLGSLCVSHLNKDYARPIILVLLVVVAIYTFIRKDFGHLHAPAFTAHKERTFGIAVGVVLGFYDGFFGPGMGSFLIFTFIGLFGFDFLSASASAKVINFGTNLASVILFASTGHVLYQFALPMAACQIAGSVAGTKVAMTKGNRFVRVLFLVVVSALICRFGWEIFRPKMWQPT